jgi:hypothetical protein
MTLAVKGEERVFDTKPYLDKGVFKRLRERNTFFGARVVADSVEWPGEIDLCYDTLYLESQKINLENSVAAPLMPFDKLRTGFDTRMKPRYSARTGWSPTW